MMCTSRRSRTLQSHGPRATGGQTWGAWPVLGLLCLGVVIAGCSSLERPARPLPELLQLRQTTDAQFTEDRRALVGRVVTRMKAQYDAYQAGRVPTPPVLNILIVSGGGDWGAFGAGFLKGWGRVPAGPMARPEFDIVTGVSTGALIAPFAFIGTEDALDRVVHLYRNPKKDWVKQRWPLYFLPNNISFAEVPGLEREMREQLDSGMMQQVANAGKDGRALLVNTTNVDDGGQRVWDVVAEAQQAIATGNGDRVHRILLASAGI